MNRILKLLVVLLVCFGTAVYAQNASEPPAPGWVAFKPTEDDRRCANYSKHGWRVSLNNDKSSILISKYEDKTRRHVIQVRDGRLVGENQGEWGGGLWWISKDGRRRKQLSDENVHGFVKTVSGVLVVVGLAHGRLDYGDMLRYVDGPRGKKEVQKLADIGWAPKAFTLETPDSVLVLSNYELLRVHTSGNKQTLAKTYYRGLVPNSLTLSSDGVVHVGMRHFIVRLTPAEGIYKEEWFVPANCTKFTQEQYDCVCSR